ncbi:hypothetical protein [Rhodoferax sp. PAMC 29310]|uniref:hypothetical protein n=1 Tax=Rhodoferax sp. PAMC 29310 TaxID=2822760 RepID=UPI001B33C12C|nr:hypothetical protein [Rhodoferax sp. PAMC 29310]
MTPTTATLAVPEWSDALLVNLQPVDDDHKAIVAALAQVVLAPDEDLMARWCHLISAMEAHFKMEDAWLVTTGFTADNCHSTCTAWMRPWWRILKPWILMPRGGLSPTTARWMSPCHGRYCPVATTASPLVA